MAHGHTLLETLRRRGYRITPQREMIIEVISSSGRHMTAEEIFGDVQGRTRAMNIATVYRTLDLLVEEGLASRIDVGTESVLYATAHHGPHIHLVCRHCGLVIEADYQLIAPLAEKLLAQYRFTADLQHISLFGICNACQPRTQP